MKFHTDKMAACVAAALGTNHLRTRRGLLLQLLEMIDKIPPEIRRRSTKIMADRAQVARLLIQCTEFLETRKESGGDDNIEQD